MPDCSRSDVFSNQVYVPALACPAYLSNRAITLASNEAGCVHFVIARVATSPSTAQPFVLGNGILAHEGGILWEGPGLMQVFHPALSSYAVS